MKIRAPDHLDLYRFPIDPWRLVEREYDKSDLGLMETLFATGNGYLGVRGIHEEGRTGMAPGTYINGFHETWHILHAEEAYGFAKTGQTIVNVPDATLDRAVRRRRAAAARQCRSRGVRARPRLPGGTLPAT